MKFDNRIEEGKESSAMNFVQTRNNQNHAYLQIAELEIAYN